MVPASLAQATSPIVDHALETGARGSTITKTDYGVIGDAMFKKSQLDLNIASLQAQTGIQEATLRSGLEMDRARLELQKADTMMSAQMNAYQIRSNIASESEKLLGSLSGAISGASTGAMVGGPEGAVIGAGIGGLMTYSGYESGGRRGGQASAAILSNISSSASLLKGGMDASKSKDALGTWSKTGAQLFSAMSAPNQTADQRMQATAQYENHLNSLNGVGAELGWNPQQTGQMIQQQRQNFEGSSSAGRRGGSGGGSTGMRDLMFEAASDKDMQNPSAKGYVNARDTYLARANNMFQQENNGKSMSRGQAADFLDETFPKQGIGSMFLKGGQGTQSSGAGRTANSATRQVNQQREQAPSQGASVPQPAQPQRTPMQATRENTVGVMAPIANAPGVTLDRATSMDMFTQPVIAEQKLAQQGAEVVKDKTLMEKLTTPSTKNEMNDAKLSLLPGNKDQGLEKWVRDTRAKNGVGANDNVEPAGQQREQSAPAQKFVMPEPEIVSVDPAMAAKEKVFKTSTQPSEIIDAFGLKGKYGKEETKLMKEAVKSTVELNVLKKEVAKMGDLGLDTQGMKNFQVWLQGNGPGAMKGSSKSGGGQVVGTGFTGSLSEFERSIKIENEGRGERLSLTKDQIKHLYKMQSQINPVSRMIAKQYNQGTLTDADVAGFKDSLTNMFDPDPDVNSVGVSTISNLLWRGFETDIGMSETKEDDFVKKQREAVMRKQIKDSDAASDGWR